MTELGSLFFYIVIFSISTLLFSFYKCENVSVRWIGVFLSVLIPSIVAGLRYQVGTDWDNYSYNMTLIRSLSFYDVFHNSILSNGEIGFLFIVKILSYCFNNEFIFGIFAFATLAFISNALIREYTEYNISIAYWIFLFIYFSNSFNLMRQTLAVAIVFWGMKYVYKKNRKRYIYIIIVLFAFLIHFSALIALPIYFLWNRKKERALNMRIYIPFAVCVGIFVVFWRNILQIFLNFGNVFISKYSKYMNNNSGKNRDFYLKALIFITILILFYGTKVKDEKIKLFLQMSFINLLICTTGFYITFFKRIGMYYEMPVIILIAATTRTFYKDYKVAINVISSVAVIVYFTLVYYIIGDSNIIPYHIIP